MSRGPVFDFHARLGSRPGAVDGLLRALDGAGIARAAISAGGVVSLDRLAAQILHGGQSEAAPDNAAVLAASRTAPRRLVPFYFGNPHEPAHRYATVAAEFRGLEISPAVHGLGYRDPRVRALVEVAAGHGHPVYTVALGRAGGRTADLIELARAYPETTFVFGHCGHIGIDAHSLGELAPYPNIVAETSGCYGAIVRVAVDRLGPDRVLFGTEYPLQHPAVELAKLVQIGLSTQDWNAVAWANAHRLIKEDGHDHADLAGHR